MRYGRDPERKKMFTVFGKNPAYGHDHALLGIGQGLINVCYEQDNGNRMAVR